MADPASSTESLGKGDRTRRRILDAAAEIFATSGELDSTLAEIGAAAGLKAGSLYFHFGSKDEIVSEVLKSGISESMHYLQSAVDEVGPSPKARLRAAISAHFAARNELSNYAVVLLSLTGRVGQIDEVSNARRHEYTEYWLALITAAQAARAIPAELDPRLVSNLLFGAMNSDLRGRWPAAAAAAAFIELIGLIP
jgi:AcrR family transcriptional regulator